MIKKEQLHKIGYFAKPHGVKGEIALLTDFELDKMSGDPCLMCEIDNIWVPFFIKSHRQKSACTTLVTFDNLDTKDKVKLLTGNEAFALLEQLPPKEESQQSLRIFFGYLVIDNRLGELGILIDVDDSTPNVLLKVDYKGRELLIPWKLFTSITYDLKTITVALPDGFLEI